MKKTKLLLLLLALLQGTNLLLAKDDLTALKASSGADLTMPWSTNESAIQNSEQFGQAGRLDKKTVSEPSPSTDISSSRIDKAPEAHIITIGEYVDFLNAVATLTDIHGLYHKNSQIVRTWEGSQYKYTFVNRHEKDVVLGLIPLDAMRYCNWIENALIKDNDQELAIGESLDSTENGSYQLEEEQLISINPHATYHLLDADPNATSFAIIANPTSRVPMSQFQNKSSNCSPLMMFGEGKKPSSNLDPRTSQRGNDRNRVGNSSEFNRNEKIINLAEAATKTANHARENLTVDQMPGGDPATRESRIHSSTEASTIADMLSVYVSDSLAKKRAADDTTPLFPIELKTFPSNEAVLQKAAAWEAAINESLSTSKNALKTLTKNYSEIEQHLEELKAVVAASAVEAKEAVNKRADAIANVKSEAFQAGGAAIGLAFANPGPLVQEGLNLGIAAGGAALAHLDVRKTAAEVAEATTNLEYTTAKIAILGKIKERAEELHERLLSLKEEATDSLETALKMRLGSGVPSLEQSLILLRNNAAEDLPALKKAHVEHLVTWATENLTKAQSTKLEAEQVLSLNQAALNTAVLNYKKAPTGKAQKEIDAKTTAEADLKKAQLNLKKSELAVKAAANYKNQAQEILEALESRDEWAEMKTEALNNLEEARMHKTSLESALHAAQGEYEKVKSIYQATSTMNSLLYPEKKQNKEAAKIKRNDCRTAVEQATLALADAEKEAASATQDLENIDARLGIWDNLKAWHMISFANFFKRGLPSETCKEDSFSVPLLETLNIRPKVEEISQKLALKPTLQENKLEIPLQLTERIRSTEAQKEHLEPMSPVKLANETSVDSFLDDNGIIKDAQEAIELGHRIDVAEKNKEESDHKIAAYKAQKAGAAPIAFSVSPKEPENEMDEISRDAREAIEFEHRIDVADKKQEQMKQKLASYRAAKAAGKKGSTTAIENVVPTAAVVSESEEGDDIAFVNKDAQDAIEISHQVDVAFKTRQAAADKLAAYKARKAGNASKQVSEKSLNQIENVISENLQKGGSSLKASEEKVQNNEEVDDIALVNKDAQDAIEISHQVDVASKARQAAADKLAAYKAKKAKK